MGDTAPPTKTKPPKAAPPPAPKDAGPQAAGSAPGNALFGKLADGGFLANLGSGLRLTKEQLASKEGIDLTTWSQPVPGIRLTRAKWNKGRHRLDLDASLTVPHIDEAGISVHVAEKDGKATFDAKVRKKLALPALNNPEVKLTISEEGQFGGSVTIDSKDLTPKGWKSLKVTGGGTLTIQGGLFTGNVDATLAYEKLGTGEVHFKVGEKGRITATGKVHVTPPFLEAIDAELALTEGGDLSGTVTVAMTQAKSPIPALQLTAGTLTVSYLNGAVSGSLSEFHAAYRGLADVTGSASISKAGAFSGEGSLALTVPGLKEASGKIAVKNGAVSGSMTLAKDAFPETLPVKKGSITATLSENGRMAFSGNVGVELGPAGAGQLMASYSETGELSIAATINLAVPGLQAAQVSVAYVDGDISGEAQIAIDPALIPGLTGNATVRYQQGLWSGETEIAYSADDGKLSGKIRVTVAQTEEGTLQLGGSGQVEAQIAPRLRGMLTATILPEGGVDVSGEIVVTEPLELFPEAKFDKELFKYSQNIPLWAILVAVIRVRAGIRGGVGPGVFRNIKVEGSYTIGSAESDPSFSISGEMFVPAFIEAYVAFGAGLGIDVVIGELTGGLEGVATAGLYGAISVVPELSYSDGDWAIEGTATLAAGARLKIGLNAWVEVEALWVTVWEETWKLGEWVWNVGPDLGLQAHMAYRFGQPGPPELDFKTSDIDTESMIQAAMPEDGPAPSGAKEALDNKAEWKGKLKEQKPAPVPPELAAQQQAPPPTPPQPPQPKPKPGPPSGGAGAEAPGQAPGQTAPGATPPPGSPGAAQAAADAAAPDSSVKGAVPASEIPNAGKPRYPAPITLAAIDEPPAPLPRTKDQELEDVKAAEQAIQLAAGQVEDSDALDDWFPRIKNRFGLVSLGWVGDFQKGFSIEGGINPGLKLTVEKEIEGTGIPSDLSKKHVTKIEHKTATVGGDKVGIVMTSMPLGPDHPQGTEAGGQDTLMDQLPVDPSVYSAPETRFVRGHLLNYDLGGLGEDQNLFPITARANMDHSNSVEKIVKKWVNEDRLWVKYVVKVQTSGNLIPLKGKAKLNAIESRLEIEVATLNTKLEPVKTYSLRVPSLYDEKKFKTGEESDLEEESKKKVVAGLDDTTATGVTKRAIDDTVTVQTKDMSTLVFPQEVYDDLVASHAVTRSWDTTKDMLQGAKGFKEKSADALYKAYKEVLRKTDKTIRTLSPDEAATFRRIVNNWDEIRNEIFE